MEKRTCLTCGELFTPKSHGQHQRFCKRGCRDAPRNERRPRQIYEDRACLACGQAFTPTVHNQTCCPPTEADRARVKGQAMSRCARRYQNHMYRHGCPPDGPPTQSFGCAQCGKSCIPGENVVGHASKFCGVQCKKRWHYDRRPNPRQWPQCKLRHRPDRGSWVEGPCPECGERVMRRTHLCSLGFCSRKCARRECSRRRRAMKAGVGYKTLTFRSIAERDNWTCQLCGDPVDASLTHPDPMSASFDHIIPLSLGGAHTEENGQLVHLLCNSIKGNGTSGTRTGGQMSMV